MFNVEQIFSSPCVVWWGRESLWCWNSALDEQKGPCRASLEAQAPVGLDIPPAPAHFHFTSALWWCLHVSHGAHSNLRVAERCSWRGDLEGVGWLQYHGALQRCPLERGRAGGTGVARWGAGRWQLPWEVPRCLALSLALVPAACGLQRGGWQELHWLGQQRLCSASACASGVLGLPRDGQGPWHVFKHMPMMPLPRERWGSALCLVSFKTQTKIKGGDFIRARNHRFRHFWIPRDSRWLFKWIHHRLRGLQAEVVWAGRSQELLSPWAALELPCPVSVLQAQLQPWSSSLALELGHPAAPLHPSCY